ncbi:MAG: PDZ domain-containing protein [Phycisphaerales bacterium]|nr:PDZ domain-containing protein [Phycisphaerales bacterium]
MHLLALSLCLIGGGDLDRLIDGLDAVAWRDREAATLAIARAHNEFPLEAIEERLSMDDLSQEQRTRLMTAVSWRYELLPRGALGVEMQRFVPRNEIGGPDAGLLVGRIVKGLPAHGLLQSGDVITHMDDTPMIQQIDLLTFVSQHWPGDEVRVRAMRPTDDGWEQVDRRVALGSMALLQGQGTLMRRNAPLDERRMLARLRRAHGPVARSLPQPLDPGRGSPRWIVLEVQKEQAALAARPDDQRRALAVARWRTWLMAIDSRLSDKFIGGARREQLQAARDALEAAITAGKN